MIFREEIRQLCDAHDRFMAEAREEAERAAPMRKSDGDHGLKDALLTAPEPEAAVFYGDDEEPAFPERQADAVAAVICELRAEFQDEIERMTQRILQTMVPLVRPGEVAEERVYALNDRVARMEQRIERRLTEALTEQKTRNTTGVVKPESETVIDLPPFVRRRNNAAA